MVSPSARMAIILTIGLTVIAPMAFAVPRVREEGPATAIEAPGYRAVFARDTLDITLAWKGPGGQRYPIARTPRGLEFALMRGPDQLQAGGLRATRAVVVSAEGVTVGYRAVIDPDRDVTLELHVLCTDAGLLVGARLLSPSGQPVEGMLWAPPRLELVTGDWDRYSFFDAAGQRHEGRVANLQPFPAYAGVSPWGQTGDTALALDPLHPALVLRSDTRQVGLGVVFVDYARNWPRSSCFLQRYAANATFLYAGVALAAPDIRWAWLAPFTPGNTGDETRRVEELVRLGDTLTAGFRPIAPPVPAAWRWKLPDVPARLRRTMPVRDINEAIVYTVNEGTAGSDYGMSLARKVGPDVLIRAWFKWNQAPPVAGWRRQPAEAHLLGALFGGGITCSALYDGENALTRQLVLDMATRGPAGQLVDAWDQPGIRHGSLSSPAYQDYLFRWCREQIDAGADYLFMDEHTAALSAREGYDDHSLADFRRYLISACPQTRGWSIEDARWKSVLGIALDDPSVCPSGRMDLFDYRAHLRAVRAIEDPSVPSNRLFPLWGDFRRRRDDRAWKSLTDRIRAYARARGRTVLLSANGLAPYVDLQVVGVWDRWTTDGGNVDLRANLLPTWRSLVERGRETAGRRVPVVLFHDWGMGEIPFPWMAVPPTQREVWMRSRGAEIYAAGGFFAWPVLGPFGCDAGRDGTLPLIAHLAAFYRQNRDLYLQGRWLGCESLRTDASRLSLATWWRPDTRELVLHVINRDVRAGRLQRRGPIRLRLPVGSLPRRAVVLSPDFQGERRVHCRLDGRDLHVTLPGLEAYSVVRLPYERVPDLSRLWDPVRVRPDARWIRPARSEFRVRPGGTVENASDLEGFLQGTLHREMRNPPVFRLHAAPGAQVQVHVRAVATAGARLQFRVDGRVVKTVDLPDRDGKNDASAHEYDRTIAFPVPAGRHRLTVDNVGGDWALVEWYRFAGKWKPW